MALRRMFSLQIVDSDAFLDMPGSAQLLYFHLAMRADDEGFVDNPKKVMRIMGANDDDYKILLAKRFILMFESGVVVIKHWLIHNIIRMDRLKPTKYTDEKSQLIVKENRAYTEMTTKQQPDDNQKSTNGMRKLSEVNLIKVKLSEERETPAQEAESFFLNPLTQVRMTDKIIKKGVPPEIAQREIKKFVSYWTELNKSGTKQRWELEKTFEINKRLATWFSRVNDFKKISETKGIRL